ncbi:MAG: transposase [Bacteroidia bacterium]
MYKATAGYYGTEGQESIDPVVFFKLLLGAPAIVNINSDRKLIEYCSNCLDVRLFLKYDIDQSLPFLAQHHKPHPTVVWRRSIFEFVSRGIEALHTKEW